MKALKKILALVLAAVLCLAATACGSTPGKIADSFREAGYTVEKIDPTSEAGMAVLDKLGIPAEEATAMKRADVYLCTKARIPLALYLSFSTGGSLKRYFTEDGAYETAKDGGRIRGNCYLRYYANNALDVYRGE